jgi:hypothetical protein
MIRRAPDDDAHALLGGALAMRTLIPAARDQPGDG